MKCETCGCEKIQVTGNPDSYKCGCKEVGCKDTKGLTEQYKQEVNALIRKYEDGEYISPTKWATALCHINKVLDERDRKVERLKIACQINSNEIKHQYRERKRAEEENQRLRNSLVKIGNYSTIFENGFSSSLNPLQEVKKMVRQALEEDRQ